MAKEKPRKMGNLRKALGNLAESTVRNWTKERKESLTKGLQFLIKDLQKEIEKQGFFSFNIEHRSPSLGPSYPDNHELLRLNVTYEQPIPGGTSSFLKSKTIEYLRDKGNSEWYKWENNKKGPLK